MKKMTFAMGLFAATAVLLTGCGQEADENKTPTQIKSEISNMTMDDIKAMMDKYQQAIEKKSAELKVEADKLAKIPLTEQLGDEAKKIKADMAEISESIKKLSENMKAYAEGLGK